MLPKEGRILALDIGTRRTGVALSDSKQRVAFLKPEIEHKTPEEAILQIEQICSEEDIKGIIAGVPLKLDGTETAQTHAVREFIQHIKKIGLPIQEMDERLTSEFAKKNEGMNKKKNPVDSLSAQILLEYYLQSS